MKFHHPPRAACLLFALSGLVFGPGCEGDVSSAPPLESSTLVSKRQSLVSGYQFVTEVSSLDTTSQKSLTASCPTGKKVVGAGYGVFDAGGGLLDGRLAHFLPSADGNSWTAKASLYNPTGTPTWRLKLSVSCAEETTLTGYEMLSETQDDPYNVFLDVECPVGKMALASGWSAVDATSGATVDVDAYESVPINPYFPGSSGGLWNTTFDTFNSGKRGVMRTICVSENLPGYAIVSASGSSFVSKTKQLYAACPAGKKAVSAGWDGRFQYSCGNNCTSSQNLQARLLHMLPNSEGTGWLVRSSHEGIYDSRLNFDWQIGVKLVCVDADAPPSACNPTLTSLAFNSAGPTNWPGACWRPFAAPDNPFVKLIPPEAKGKLHTNSANIVSQVLAGGRPEEILGRKNGHSGEPVYYSRVTDPLYTISCTGCPLNGLTLHIPAGALPEGGVASNGLQSGSDSHLTVIDLDGGFEYDFWQLQTLPLPASTANNPSPPAIVVSAGNRIALNSNGLYNYTTTPDATGGLGQNGTAAYFANSQGKIRLEELQAGAINHALFMLVRCHNDTEGPSRSGRQNIGVVYPADARGRLCSSLSSAEPSIANAPAMGAHFFYDRTPAEIDALALPAWKKTVLKALSQYGAFVGDTANRWGFDAEGSYQYFSAPEGNGWERWFNYAASTPGWALWLGDASDPGERYKGRLWDVMGGPGATASDIADANTIDFANRLRVLQPCVSKGECG